jgi:MoxR-like ATPase
VPVPLISVVGATNEVPDDEALQAFYDRFALRVPVEPVGDAQFVALLQLPANLPQPVARLDSAELAHLRARAASVALPQAVVDGLVQVRTLCTARQIPVSDRRWRKLAALLQVQAASRSPADAGSVPVSLWDLWLMPFVLAARPEQVPALRDWFMTEIALAVPVDVQWLTRATEAFEKQLEIETSAPAVSDDHGAGKLALARSISGADEGGQMLVRMVSERARKHYSALHVSARLAQVGEVEQRVVAVLQSVSATLDAVRAQAGAHAWLPPSWREAIDAVHRDNVQRAGALRSRLQAVADGFAALPVDAALATPEPSPVALPA